MQLLNEEILAQGLPYMIEMNTGTVFEDVIFTGTKYFNGKRILVFITKQKHQLTVNPSFHTFTLEQQTEDKTKTTKETING